MKALILVDIQKGFADNADWGGLRNNPNMEENALTLLANWRSRLWPVIHIQHASLNPESPLQKNHSGHAFKNGFEPLANETHFVKNVNSSFIGTGLESYLREKNIDQLVICGISTEHCVSTTTRMAANLGFKVELVADACHAWPHGAFDAETIHNVEIALLSDEFATIRSTRELTV